MWNDNYQQSGMPNVMNVPPLMPPMCLLNQLPALSAGPPETETLQADNNATQDMVMSEEPPERDDQTKDRGRGNRSNYSSRDNRDKNRKDLYSRDRSNHGRSRDRHNDGRNERDGNERERGDNRNDRGENKSRRERRPSKWSTEQVPGLLGHAPGVPLLSNPMMPGTYNYNANNMNPMMGSGMDMNNMQNMNNTANMSNMPNMNMPHMHMQNMNNMSGMPGMQMPVMPGMNNMQNMMGNMMDSSLVNQNMNQMADQSMNLMANQPIYTSAAVLLPPVPGATLPDRREKPPGCRTIFIGGLPMGVHEDVINEIFSRFGTIVHTKLHQQGICHLRFQKHESVEMSFFISGYRFKLHEQSEQEATTIFVDYALNRDDQNEFEKQQRFRQPTPPRIEHFSQNTLNALMDKIKSDDQFAEAAPTLATWLERGECNKRNANVFYSLIQASNNQVRRLFNEKMVLDEEFHNLKTSFREKFAKVVSQFEQVAQILSAAKHQRASDHFTKQQRRNIEMWLKMTEELENIKEEFNTLFDEEEMEKIGKNVVPAEKYEQLKMEHDTLIYELEGYKNEAFLAKDEAERKFEKFKAHFIAQQALQNKQPSVYPPLPSAPPRQPPPPAPLPPTPGPPLGPSEAKLVSLITAFLMVHPLGASPDYLVSYVRSLVPNVSQAVVLDCLQKHNDVFACRTSGVGASIEHRWQFVTFDIIKKEH